MRFSVSSRRSRRTQDRGRSAGGSLVAAGGEGGGLEVSERRFQMGSMGDDGGEMSTLTAAAGGDVDEVG